MKHLMKKLKRKLGLAVMSKDKNKAKHYRELYSIMEDKFLTEEQALIKYGF